MRVIGFQTRVVYMSSRLSAILFLILPLGAAHGDSSGLSAAARGSLLESYARLPLHFERNEGQAPPAVKYLTRIPGGTIFFTEDAAVMRLLRTSASTEEEAVVTMRLAGAQPPASPAGQEKLPGVSNYFLGSDPARWRTNVGQYGRLLYQNVTRALTSFTMATAASWSMTSGWRRAVPRVIEVSFEGLEGMQILESGDLLLETPSGELVFKNPLAYQESQAPRQEVACRYTILGKGRVGFQFGEYDRNRALVIDPTLAYSTYLGGQTDVSYGHDITVDGDGNAYLCGDTMALDFPTASPIQPGNKGKWDVFVAKLDPTGTALIFSTYLGGTMWESPWGIALDNSRNVYIAGATYSANYPVVSAAQAVRRGSRTPS
jgi:hypothetical protein